MENCNGNIQEEYDFAINHPSFVEKTVKINGNYITLKMSGCKKDNKLYTIDGRELPGDVYYYYIHFLLTDINDIRL